MMLGNLHAYQYLYGQQEENIFAIIRKLKKMIFLTKFVSKLTLLTGAFASLFCHKIVAISQTSSIVE
jgi:hypothetical protein